MNSSSSASASWNETAATWPPAGDNRISETGNGTVNSADGAASTVLTIIASDRTRNGSLPKRFRNSVEPADATAMPAAASSAAAGRATGTLHRASAPATPSTSTAAPGKDRLDWYSRTGSRPLKMTTDMARAAQIPSTAIAAGV